ncbi:acetylglutamate kinase [Vagococcus sp. BWB3-3]|uniref:Acetylglutamate kinase n=1 Tax=Vagococcus allomyrinae TaxID=2794353 RepID=A0A940P5H6_9ENTE|nr:acetylglutamate kinase [Vagococcus allomyrinae]MBP1041944.1 acetylglutamate kinase [Vagococcus allomyrinae]
MTETIVVKLGGVASDNLQPTFFEKIRQWQLAGKRVVIVHGGGHYINTMLERLDVVSTFHNGMRVTTKETLDIVKMVLIGQVQPTITSIFQEAGFAAVGLNAMDDRLLTAHSLKETSLGYVGEVVSVNTDFLTQLLNNQQIPVIAPLGITDDSQWLNVNADQTACAIAQSLQADQLYLLTDVPGIKTEAGLLETVKLAEVADLKATGVIKGGMLPKLNSAVTAVIAGVKQVHITNQINQAGTVIHHSEVLVS